MSTPALSRVGIAAACTAVRQIDQDLDALEENFVGFVSFQAGDKTNPTGVALPGRERTVPALRKL